MTLLGLLLLAVPGFALGLFAGVAWREPGLLGGHLLGETRELALDAPAGGDLAKSSAGPAGDAVPDVAAAPPAAPAAKLSAPRAASPAPPPAQASPAAAPPPAGGRLSVQVGAFADAASAEALVARLARKGYSAFVSPSTGEAATRWRVRVGPIASRETAERTAARLKSEERLPTWVVDDGRS